MIFSSNLRKLSSEDPLLDSRSILVTSNARYARALAWIELQLQFHEQNDALWKLLNCIPSRDRFFLLRCAGIRSLIDSTCSTLYASPVQEANAEHLYAQLRMPFEAYSKRSKSLIDDFTTEDWAAIGADLGHVLLEPFPFVVTAWGGDPRTRDDLDWPESEIVRELFQEHMAHTVGSELCVVRPFPTEILRRVESVLNFFSHFRECVLYDIVLNVRHICMIDFLRWQSMADKDYREIGQSVSSHLIPSTSFFSCHSLSSNEALLEAIYHEALHKKLSNTIVAYKVLPDSYDSSSSPLFHSDWNIDTDWNSNMWEFDRALYAYHVYVHLYLFFGAMSEFERSRELIDTSWAMDRHRVAKVRARKLGAWIEEQKADLISDHGCILLDHLNSAMEI